MGSYMDYTTERKRRCYFYLKPKCFCFRWNCQRLDCREARFYLERERLMKGAKHWMWRGELWFITIRFSSGNEPQRWDPLNEMREISRKFFRSLKRRATVSAEPLEYVYVFGVNSRQATVPGEPHVHALATWLPDAFPAPTSDHPHRYKSAILEKWAKKHGVTLWIEKAESDERVGNYCAKNVRDLEDSDLPRRFRRINYSRTWCNWTKQVRTKAMQNAANLVRYKKQKKRGTFVAMNVIS
jgi:hypothetical protein